jgi:hypothetical protein
MQMPGDGLHGKAQHARAPGPAGDPRDARIDHEPDARDGDAGLGHVGGQDHAARVAHPEDALLLRGRQARMEREHLASRKGRHADERVRGIEDVAFTAEERQDVARALADALLDPAQDALHRRALGLTLGIRPPAHLDGVQPPSDLHHRRAAEVRAESVDVDGRGCHDHLEIGAPV